MTAKHAPQQQQQQQPGSDSTGQVDAAELKAARLLFRKGICVKCWRLGSSSLAIARDEMLWLQSTSSKRSLLCVDKQKANPPSSAALLFPLAELQKPERIDAPGSPYFAICLQCASLRAVVAQNNIAPHGPTFCKRRNCPT